MADWSPFLAGALASIYAGTEPSQCALCGYDWSLDPESALEAISSSAARYPALLDGRDGMVPAADGGWNATAYLWHLTDLARSWSERWVQLAAMPGSTLVGWDPDILAEARNYRSLPTTAALWALASSTAAFVALGDGLPRGTTFLHGDWGVGTVADGTRWLGHEYVHHLLDVDARASARSS